MTTDTDTVLIDAVALGDTVVLLRALAGFSAAGDIEAVVALAAGLGGHLSADGLGRLGEHLAGALSAALSPAGRPDPSCNGYVTARCAACDGPLPAGRARRWCSDACRQAGFRRRRQADTPLPALAPGRPKKPVTVYECPECESRLVGEQRCFECGVFMRRVGVGGPCPHCAEPVAAEELMEGAS